jgi:hypothetical protein
VVAEVSRQIDHLDSLVALEQLSARLNDSSGDPSFTSTSS